MTYPLSLPAGCPVAVRFGGTAVVAVAQSPFTLASQVQAWPGQMWVAEVDLPRMRRADAEAWCAFRLDLNGREGTFLLPPPLAGTPRGTPAGVPVVDGAGQSGRALATRGWTPSAPFVLRRGDYLQLGAGATARLYKVLADVSADAAGEAALTIWPALRSSPADGAAIVTSNPAGVFRMATNEMVWDIDRILYGHSFSCHEAL